MLIGQFEVFMITKLGKSFILACKNSLMDSTAAKESS